MYTKKNKVQFNQQTKKQSYTSQHSAVQKKINPSANVPKSNQTGLPDRLKEGLESLSGFSMNDVRVHYNSPLPARMKALAYTQGSHIYVAPGQDQYLPHEAWHVVQQKQGRVQPTAQINSIMINDNPDLEHEADVMGSKVLQQPDSSVINLKTVAFKQIKPVQRKIIYKGKETAAKTFYEDYMKDPKFLDKYTDEDGKVHRISDQYLSDEAIRAFLKDPKDLNSGESDSYYYIGRKNDIINVISETYAKLKPFFPFSVETDANKSFLIKCAIHRIYTSDKNNFDRHHIEGQGYSEHLVDQVYPVVDARPLNTPNNGYEEYTLYNYYPEDGQVNHAVNAEGPDNKSYDLKYGKYIYRTFSNQDCQHLISISTMSQQKYMINKNKKEDYKRILSGHAGSILQALKYKGVLVRFEMKSGFNRSILHTMSLGGEGSRGGNGGGIGLKSESDEVMKESKQKAFSFYLHLDCFDMFIDNIMSFEVLELGKVGI
ncbi:MAG: DUF4157 domain-containing protein [Acetatifactor sp.]|nr:DUF4157 domain-containing protein [Acetatifactor sp.]